MTETSHRGSRSRAALAATVLAAFAFLSCTPQDGAPSPSPPTTAKEAFAAVRATPPPKAAAPVSLGELPEAVARLETLREEVEKAISVDDAEQDATLALDVALRRIERFRRRVDGLPFDDLSEVSRRLANTSRSVKGAGATIEARLHPVEEDARQVEELKSTFEAFAVLAGQVGVPPALRLRAGICRAQLDDLPAQLARTQTAILLLVDELAEARGSAAAMTAETQLRLVETRRRFAASSEEPIWNLRIGGEEVVFDRSSPRPRPG